MISAVARRRLHELLDEALDLLSEEGREPPKARRVRPPKERVLPPGIDDLTLARALAAGKKAGLL